jgi:hypothetical protein
MADPSLAADRRLVVIVETPFKDPDQPPSREQMGRASEVQSLLSERMRGLLIDDYTPLDGREAGAKTFQDADQIFQVVLNVSAAGYRIEARIFDRRETNWRDISNRLFADKPAAQTVEAEVAKELVPRLLVGIVELAHSERPVLLADCLFPASNRREEADLMLGRFFTEKYATRLKDHAELRRMFAVVRLVPSAVPQVYDWWCLDVQPPRSGRFRTGTTTIFGSIETIRPGRPTVSLELRRTGKTLASDLIDLDLARREDTVRRITTAVEGLANALEGNPVPRSRRPGARR